MKFIRKIAVKCGITGGVLALFGVAFLLLRVPMSGQTGFAWYPVSLGIITILSVLALASIIFRRRLRNVARAFLWAAGLTILLVSLWVDPTVLGFVFLPTSILFLISAVGLHG